MVEAISQDMDDYVDRMRFPILFSGAFDDTSTNGLGALPDLINGGNDNDTNSWTTFSFTYKLGGINADKIAPDEVIMYDASPNKLHQLYRITQVTPTLDGIQVSGVSILGDFLAQNPIKKLVQFATASPNTAWKLIQDNLEYGLTFINFDSDSSKTANINFPGATNATNLLLDPDQEGDEQTQSIVGLFGGFIDDDNFTIHHRTESGVHRHHVIRYGDNLKTASQETSVEGAFTGAYFHASYTPGQAHANTTNVDWANYETGWTSKGTVTYAINGPVDIYDSPVEGHHKIGTLNRGQKIKVGNPLADGTMVPSIKDPNLKLEADTVNGDTWYPLEGGGWIDGQWITFDKSGDYLVSDVQGHGHVDVSATDQPGTKFPVKGSAVVTYIGDGDKIHIYYSPFKGKDHYRIIDPKTGKEKTLSNGKPITFHYEAIDENGHPWYQIKPHEWVYGPHLSISKDDAIASYPANGTGYVKKNAQKYVVNKKGKVVAAPKHKKIISSKTKNTKKGTWVKRKINGKTKKTWKWNAAYFKAKKKKIKTTVNTGYAKIHGQTVEGGTTYYQVGNNVLVKSSDFDWKKRRSVKPKTPEQIIKNSAIKDGKIEIYAEPRKNSAINWAVDTKTPLDIQSQATGDGETWDYVTYAGKSGWIMDKYIDYSADEDFEPTTIKDTSGVDDGTPLTSDIDQQQVIVELPENPIIADSCIGHESQRIQDVDLSSYIQHNDEDTSGEQPDGTFKATDDDISQLRDAAQRWMQEHKIGEVPVSLTIEAAQLRKMNGELQTCEKGDIVPVYFPEVDITQEAPVTHTHYNWITHEYDEIQIGDPPKTYEHLLKEATQKSVDSLKRSTNAAISHSTSLTSRIHNALLHEGSDRVAGEKKIAEKLGMVNKAHDKLKGDVSGLAVSIKDINNAMINYDAQMNETKSWIESGGSQVLQFYNKNTGTQSYINPTEIRARTDNGGYMIFNSNGLIFEDSGGKTVTAIDSTGWINAEYINAGQIKSLNANELTVTGHFSSTVGGYQMTMGEYNPNAASSLGGVDTSRGFSVGTTGFGANLGSGSLNIGGDNGHVAKYGPSYYQMSGDSGSLTVQLNSTNANFDLINNNDEYIMKQGHISIHTGTGWHRVITSYNISTNCYVMINGKKQYISVDSFGSNG